jgi:hypothetical protein
MPNLSAELAQLRSEMTQFRRESRQDTGNLIEATFTAMRDSADKQARATIKAAQTREYLSKPRSKLS